MKRWLPAPVLSAALFAMWLLLQRSVALSDVLIGAWVGLLLPWLLAPLRPPTGRVRRPLVLLLLVLRVGGDVVLSALQVAARVLHRPARAPSDAFVVLPLTLRDPHALAALAVIAAVVPGTVWCELAPDRSALLLHVFELEDEAAFVQRYHQRYLQPLQEIFE